MTDASMFALFEDFRFDGDNPFHAVPWEVMLKWVAAKPGSRHQLLVKAISFEVVGESNRPLAWSRGGERVNGQNKQSSSGFRCLFPALCAK
jgi:hypothetical protein